jgi:hypothetical protein
VRIRRARPPEVIRAIRAAARRRKEIASLRRIAARRKMRMRIQIQINDLADIGKPNQPAMGNGTLMGSVTTRASRVDSDTGGLGG